MLKFVMPKWIAWSVTSVSIQNYQRCQTQWTVPRRHSCLRFDPIFSLPRSPFIKCNILVRSYWCFRIISKRLRNPRCFISYHDCLGFVNFQWLQKSFYSFPRLISPKSLIHPAPAQVLFHYQSVPTAWTCPLHTLLSLRTYISYPSHLSLSKRSYHPVSSSKSSVLCNIPQFFDPLICWWAGDSEERGLQELL